MPLAPLSFVAWILLPDINLIFLADVYLWSKRSALLLKGMGGTNPPELLDEMIIIVKNLCS